MKSVAVFGAGISGLSAAHEFARLGYRVSVYEANCEAGGFFRSARTPMERGMPSEYSWHGMGPWYHNTFDVMKQIPFDATGSVYEKALSRPIDFGTAPDKGRAEFDHSHILHVSRMLRMSGLDSVRWAWLMLKTWAANRRTLEQYARLNASEQWKPLLSDLGWRTWRATFGPWIGSDWTNVSLHTTGQFFLKLLTSRPWHEHAADADGPAWTHGSRDGWLLLRGPSSEVWTEKWVAHLMAGGVAFFWKQSLQRLSFDGTRIMGAHLESGEEVCADVYVLATNPFAAADILERTPQLAQKDQLRLFRPLVQDGPHTQVSFRIAFAERLAWPRERTAIIAVDSEFNLTLFAQEQAWVPESNLGDGIQSLWTGTACVATKPGRIYGKPLVNCTKEEFIEEVMAQLSTCESLDSLIKEANGGRGWRSFVIIRIEVWHEWRFSPQGIQSHQPKWVNSTKTQPYLPTQVTPVPNLVLAGAHTKTAADVWSIEGAVESGRLAARAIEPAVTVIPQYKPLWLRLLGRLDDVCFSARLPHVLNMLLGSLSLALAAMLLLILKQG
jgi:glycine/D-amino acid oxidase-like deaminating enzyme